jgi:hypothetical protein
MSNQKNEVREKVREWMRSADEDIRFAEEGMRFGGSSSYRIVAYLLENTFRTKTPTFAVKSNLFDPRTDRSQSGPMW